VSFVKLKRNNPKSMDFCLKRMQKQCQSWDRLCVNLIGPYNIKSNVKGVKILPLKCITMIDPATGWFEIKEYNDKKSITVTNIVEQEWLTHYPQPYLVTLDHGSKFIGQDFCDMCINDYRIKRKVISTQNLQASECDHRACTSNIGKFN
jgi:hypothetical protein